MFNINGDYFQRMREQEIKEAKAAYDLVKVGDYVNMLNWFGDVWGQVVDTYEGAAGFSWVTYWSDVGKKDMTTMNRIRKVHKKDDPWDFREVSVAYTADGGFGDKHGILPAPFLYKGHFTIRPWLWNYCGKNCMPKKPKDFGNWASKAGVPITGVHWNRADYIIQSLRATKIKGWYPICEKIAEVKYDNTIYP